MNGTLSKIFIFTAGAAVGALVTWKITKTMYERIAQEEIDDVKEYYSKRFNDEEPADEEEEEEEDPDEYEDLLESCGYTSAATEGESTVRPPHVITPEEFGDCGYELETLYYYADGVLTDDQDEPIEDVENVVGIGATDHFGEHEEDAVHVRNERYKIDYEILRVDGKYSDVINPEPHRAEAE